ncbi:MAG: hypothetical protein ACOCRK_11450, partial [bacterium]
NFKQKKITIMKNTEKLAKTITFTDINEFMNDQFPELEEDDFNQNTDYFDIILNVKDTDNIKNERETIINQITDYVSKLYDDGEIDLFKIRYECDINHHTITVVGYDYDKFEIQPTLIRMLEYLNFKISDSFISTRR